MRYEVLVRMETDPEATPCKRFADLDLAVAFAQRCVCGNVMTEWDHAWVFDHTALVVPYAIRRDYRGLHHRPTPWGSWVPYPAQSEVPA